MMPDDTDQHFISMLPLAKIVGIGLVLAGVVMLSGTAFELYWLFSHPANFGAFQTLLPERLIVAEFDKGWVYLPREVFEYGVPLSLLGLGVKIGEVFLRWGLNYMDPKRREPKPAAGTAASSGPEAPSTIPPAV